MLHFISSMLLRKKTGEGVNEELGLNRWSDRKVSKQVTSGVYGAQ